MEEREGGCVGENVTKKEVSPLKWHQKKDKGPQYKR